MVRWPVPYWWLIFLADLIIGKPRHYLLSYYIIILQRDISLSLNVIYHNGIKTVNNTVKHITFMN